MCKLLRSVIIGNDYKPERTIKETVRCRKVHFFQMLKKSILDWESCAKLYQIASTSCTRPVFVVATKILAYSLHCSRCLVYVALKILASETNTGTAAELERNLTSKAPYFSRNIGFVTRGSWLVCTLAREHCFNMCAAMTYRSVNQSKTWLLSANNMWCLNDWGRVHANILIKECYMYRSDNEHEHESVFASSDCSSLASWGW